MYYYNIHDTTHTVINSRVTIKKNIRYLINSIIYQTTYLFRLHIAATATLASDSDFKYLNIILEIIYYYKFYNKKSLCRANLKNSIIFTNIYDNVQTIFLIS